MTTSSPSDSLPAAALTTAAAERVPYLVFLSGTRRGTMQRLVGRTLRLAVDNESRVRLSDPLDPSVADARVTLHRSGSSYELEVAPGGEVWVNGVRVSDSRLLEAGDLIELGRAGPLLRYRFYPRGPHPQKSVTDVLADGVNGVRRERRGLLARLSLLVSSVARDLMTQTSPWFRLSAMAVFGALVLITAFLAHQSIRLERRITLERERIEGIAELVERTEREGLKREELQELRGRLEQRLEALEARSEAVARVVAQVSPAVVFLQGAYGFVDPVTDRPLRQLGTERGAFTLEDEGPLVEIFFTGTGFVATTDGLLLTSRHIARPWEADAPSTDAARGSLEPVLLRLRGFRPGVDTPFEVDFVAASDEADVAVLRVRDDIAFDYVPALGTRAPRVGQEVVVLGYPAGIRALLARADPAFTEALMADAEVDFWSAAQRLAAAGYILPLATRGILSQITSTAIAYDAETTAGGSGGPVVDLDGVVIGVTEAIVPGFGGSNLGVPIVFGRVLLEAAQATP